MNRLQCYYITNDKTIKIYGLNEIRAVFKMLGYTAGISIIQSVIPISAIVASFVVNGIIIGYKTL